MSGARHKTSWTDEKVAELRRLVAAGHTIAQSAIKLGLPYRATLGKIQRLGLTPKQEQRQVHRVRRPKLAVGPDRYCHNLTDPNRADKLLRRFSWESAE